MTAPNAPHAMRLSSSTPRLFRPLIEPLEDRIVISGSVVALPINHAAIALKPTVAATATASQSTVRVATASAGLPLGGNLNFQTDRIQDHAFVDLVLATRGFYNLAGRIDQSTGAAALAYTNAQGWPTEDFSFSVNDQSEYGVQITPGTYSLSFTGPQGVVVTTVPNAPGPRLGPAVATNTGTITLVNSGYNAATQVQSYNVNVSSGIYTLAFSFTNTQGQVTNVHCLQPGYNPNSYPIYTTQYVNFLRAMGPNVLRFMDFTQTNNNTVANWSDRSLPSSPTFATKGVAWEDVIALANTLNVGIWINVPAMATDDYVTQLASLIQSTLNPGLPIYVEYSNEVWNSSFSQYAYNQGQAVAELQSLGSSSNLDYDKLAITSANYNTFSQRLYARRTVQISNIFKSVWIGAGKSNPINSTVKVVLAGQEAVLSMFNNMLQYVNANYGAPNSFFYSFATAPYIGLNQYADSANITNLTSAQALQGFSDSISYLQNSGLFATSAGIASQWGLKIDAYEAGEDTTGSLNITAKNAAVLSPANTAIMERYLNLWYAEGGDQLNWYTLGGRTFDTQYGSWSISNDITNYAEPRELAFLSVRNGTAQPLTDLTPVANGYAADGTYANQNYNGATQLEVKDATPNAGYVRNSYIEFNLSGAATISTATLQLYGELATGSPESSITIAAYATNNASWTESGLTFNNAPAATGSALATAVISGTTPAFYTLNLTNFFKQEQTAGIHNVTIRLVGTAFTSGTVMLNSRQAYYGIPQLLITTVTPTPVASAIVVSSTANPVVAGQSVTFTATPTGEISAVPTGTVTFKDGSTTLGNVALNASGVATLTTSALSAGTHNITAVYAGDANFTGSTSPISTQTIAATPALVTSQVGTGAAQRSTLTSFQVAFNEPVNFSLASFTVYYETVADNQAYQAGTVPSQTFIALSNSADIAFSSPDGGTTWVFTPVLGGSLDRTAGAGNSAGLGIFADGVYRLVLHGAAISDLATGVGSYNSGADQTAAFDNGSGTSYSDFAALYGDLSGQAVVNNLDVGQLRTSFVGGAGSYNAALDYRGIETQLSNLDVAQFKKRFLVLLQL